MGERLCRRHGTQMGGIIKTIPEIMGEQKIWPCHFHLYLNVHKDIHEVSYIAGRFFTIWATRKAQRYIWEICISVQFSWVWFFVTPWTAACQASLFITNSRSLLKLMSIKLVKPSNHLILCHPLLFLLSIFPRIRVFSNESVLHIRWPKYWSFSFSISPSNEHQRLISFRMDWLDLLAVQGTLKSLLQHHSSKASIPRCSAFFIVQLSHPYMTTGKTKALTRRIYSAKPAREDTKEELK